MASEQERQLFASEVLAAVAQEAARLNNMEVTGFMAMVGRRYARALMVVGRAVNGWTRGVFPNDLAAHATAEDYSHDVLESVNGGEPCPMMWVTENWGNDHGYNTNSSAFWRVIRGVVAKLNIADVGLDSWPSHLVWSNLYKVSPAEGGNPGAPLCRTQLAGCRELFKLELQIYNPSRLLFTTGMDWAAPFLDDFHLMPDLVAGFDYVEGFGTLTIDPAEQPIQYVVVAHPQTRPEVQWIEEVCCLFER